VTAFAEAYKWIETYMKAGEYDTAIMAVRELLLKVKTGVTYYLNAQKKVATLATSNIQEVAKAAKSKHKIIESELQSLHEWEEKLRKLITICEEQKSKQHARLEQDRVRGEIHQEVTVIRAHIKKNEITQAYHLAKKLLSTHHDSKEAIDILNKTQSLYGKSKTKEDHRLEDEKKREKFLREVGVTMKKKEDAEDDGEKKSFKWIDRIKIAYAGIADKNKERNEYLKRQKSLRNIEQLLLRSGSISKVNNEENSEEIMTIMESGLTKDIGNFKIDGYEFFGKIIGKDKIVGDTFGTYKDGTKTIFYFGDATGHGVQAGLTVSMMTKIFFEQAKKIKSITDLFFEVNNKLKESLKGKVFVTAVFFEHESMGGKLRYIGAGHDPMIFHHHKTGAIEKIIPGGLATGVRRLVNVGSIKLRELPMEDNDIFVGYTDGILEARNPRNELYGFERLSSSVHSGIKKSSGSPARLYESIMQDVQEFMGNGVFLDDVSIFIFKRNSSLDVITNKSELDALLVELDNSQRTIKIDLHGKTRAEIQEEIRKGKHRQELQLRLINMEQLYKIGELARLKQEITYCYKNGFIDDKMDFYLKKIIKNEDKVKSMKLEDRLERKYEMLKELYDKGEYAVVIREVYDVIYKNGNI
jgi:serine phosphatase RsbU (regulator of sigma subunit)